MSSSTSNSDSGMRDRDEENAVGESTRRVRQFAIRFVFFCVPLVLLWLPLEFFLWKAGESIPASTVLERQVNADRELLYGRGLLNQQFNVYKVAGWRRFKPRIVALGSSRVWRLRRAAFHPREADFYNAGGMLQCVADLQETAAMIADGRLPKPEAIIVGIDPWWFKQSHPNRTWLDRRSLGDDAYRIAARRNVVRRLIADPSLLQKDSAEHLGLFGRIGFRLDGTMKVADEVIANFERDPVYVDRESPPILERIQRESGRFSESKPSEECLQDCLSAVARLREQGVRVIAFFPPFANECWTAFQASDAIKHWMSFYIDKVIPQVTENADEVIEFGDSRALEVDDTYFLDGMHAGEVLSSLQWIRLVEQQNQSEDGDAFYRQFAPQFVRQQLSRCSTPLAYD